MDLNKCQSKISRVYRRFSALKKRRQGYYLIRISIECKRITSPYFLVGDFTNPKWTAKIPLIYSLKYQEYFRELWLKPGSNFKFLQKSQYFIHPSYPTTTDSKGIEVNTFALELSPLDELRSLLGMHIKQKTKKNYKFFRELTF